MIKKPVLSIVIPCHNEEAFILPLLQSIESQPAPHIEMLEVIVVDNCSTDKTQALVADYASNSKLNIKVQLEPLLGVSRAKNCGARYANGQYLLFLDADLTLADGFLSEVFAQLSAGVGASTIRLLADNNSQILGHLVFLILEQIKTMIGRPFGKMLIKKSIFDEISGFDPSIKLGENGDLLSKAKSLCRAKDIKFGHIKKPIYCSIRRFQNEGYFLVLAKWLSAYLGTKTHDYQTISQIDSKSSGCATTTQLRVFFLGFDHQKTMQSLNRLSQLFQTSLSAFTPKITIIDNSPDLSIYKTYPEQTLVGDNECNDFSGWQVAWSRFLEEPPSPRHGWVLFVNDTFEKNYGDDFLNNLTPELVAAAILKNEIVGYVDDFPKTASLLGKLYQQWIRSNFILAPMAAFSMIQDLRFPIRDDRVFSNEANEFWANGDVVSKNFKAYISSWLFGESNEHFPEYKLKWHNAKSFNEINKPFFRRKAISIMSEHYLGIQLFDSGLTVRNLNLALAKNPNRHIEDYYLQQQKHRRQR